MAARPGREGYPGRFWLMGEQWVTIGLAESLAHTDVLLQFDFKADPSNKDRLRTTATKAAIAFLTQHKIPRSIVCRIALG